MTAAVFAALLARIDELAVDVGRLQGRVDPAAAYLLERVANHLGWLDVLVRPTAGELYRDYLADGADDEIAVAEALAATEARALQLRRVLGLDRRRP